MASEQDSLKNHHFLKQMFVVCIFFVIATPPISRVMLHTTGNSYTVLFQFIFLLLGFLTQVLLGKIRRRFFVFLAIFFGRTLPLSIHLQAYNMIRLTGKGIAVAGQSQSAHASHYMRRLCLPFS